MDTERSVFEYRDYRKFLSIRVGPEGTRTGARLAIAKFISCHSSYLTKVLDGRANLSLEQSYKLGQFFRLSREETDYLILLVEKARAGTRELETYFNSKIEEIQKARLQLKERVPIRKTLNREDQSIYYSSWQYAAIHMALTIPKLRTRSAISKYFGISEDRTVEILRFLVSVGLAAEKNGTYNTGTAQLHLEGDSPNILKHHSHWRIQAILSCDQSEPGDLHYTGVVTLSKKDAEVLREKLVQVIQESIAFITQAKDEEDVLCLSLDWFSLKTSNPS